MDKEKNTILEMDKQQIENVNTALKGTLAAVFYGVCSVSSALVTKLLMDTLNFDFPVFIMVIQMLFTITTLEILCFFHLIDLPPYTIKRGISFAAPAFFYGTNSVLALTALSNMNIAMYGVLKRCVPLSTMILSLIILKTGCPKRFTMYSVILLTLGCIIAGYGDLSFNLTAYICGIGSNFSQALYLLLVQKRIEEHYSVMETLQLNCFNTLPLLLVAAIVNGEITSVAQYPNLADAYFLFIFFMCVTVGMLLNYSLFLCTSLTSALTTSVVGGLKALVQTLIGLFTFGGVSYNLPTFLGISMNLVGGIAYIWARYSENRSKKKNAKEVTRLPQSKSDLSNGNVSLDSSLLSIKS